MSSFKNTLFRIFHSKPSYYESIHDLPIGIFNKIIETNDYSLLLKSGKMDKPDLYRTWYKIYDEFLRAFGTPKQYNEYVRLMRRWRDEIIRVSNGEKYRESFAKIALNEADLITHTVENTFYKTLTFVSKVQGYPINPMTTTVFMFYSYLKSLEELNG